MDNHAPTHAISSSQLRDLILPILACLPTAFVSSEPPPALLPLLSPILRQRVHLFSSGASRNAQPPSQGSWLKFLTWSPESAQRLVEIVSRLQLEPHPVSGELELWGDSDDSNSGKVWYRKLDEETVQARCNVQQYDLGFVYVWSTNVTGGTGLENGANGEAKEDWMVAEVVPLDGGETLEREGWESDLREVEQSYEARVRDARNNALSRSITIRVGDDGDDGDDGEDGEEDDDDAYWAMYDRTPGKSTPGMSRTQSAANAFRNRGLTEQEYFSQYGQVQPALDAHDPDGEPAARAISRAPPAGSVVGDVAGQRHDRLSAPPENFDNNNFMNLNSAIEQPNAAAARTAQQEAHDANPPSEDPDPISASVASLKPPASIVSTAAETSIRHHISSEIKSMSRLAQGVGIDRDEFTELVQRELGLLSLVEL